MRIEVTRSVRSMRLQACSPCLVRATAIFLGGVTCNPKRLQIAVLPRLQLWLPGLVTHSMKKGPGGPVSAIAEGSASVAGITAVVTTIGLTVCLLCLGHGRSTAGEVTQVQGISRIRTMGARCSMDLVITIRLSFLVYVVAHCISLFVANEALWLHLQHIEPIMI